jgi:hypothetical protein
MPTGSGFTTIYYFDYFVLALLCPTLLLYQKVQANQIKVTLRIKYHESLEPATLVLRLTKLPHGRRSKATFFTVSKETKSRDFMAKKIGLVCSLVQ